jgi:hypothetical protein
LEPKASTAPITPVSAAAPLTSEEKKPRRETHNCSPSFSAALDIFANIFGLRAEIKNILVRQPPSKRATARPASLCFSFQGKKLDKKAQT